MKSMEQPSMNSKIRSFTYSEIVKITANFYKLIGKGGFGEVYFGILYDGTNVAVKISSSSSKQNHKAVLQEAKLLTFIHHQNLVSLVGYCDENGNEALIYDYMPNGNLKHHLSEKSQNLLSWIGRLQIALEVACGLTYLHGCKPPIVHRDLKPDNILFNESMQAKIADFGLSRAFTTESISHITTCPGGTPGYLDPESYKIGRVSKKSDVYSFGVILLELLTGQPAVMTQDKENIIHITNWIDPLIKRRDIRSIVNPRLNGEFNINAARTAIKIAMSCVKSITKRPQMSHVLAELKECFDIELHSRLVSENGWLTNVLGRLYKNSTKGQKGATMKSMKERPMESMEEQTINARNRIFTYIQIATITLNFETVIGEGEFGKVYLGTLNDASQVAVEVLSQSSMQNYREFQAQVESLRLFDHRNVVSLVGYCDEKDNKALIYKYMLNGNLKQQLSGKSERILSWNERLQIALDVANGLEYLRAGCDYFVVHGNLKSTNILLDTYMQAKIGGLTFARYYGKEANYDPSYFHPNRVAEFTTDLHSFGLILLELITGPSKMISGKGYDSIQWLRTPIYKRGIHSIVDPRLEGKFNINTIREVIELALSCARITPNKCACITPNMSYVIAKLNELKESIRTEIVPT